MGGGGNSGNRALFKAGEGQNSKRSSLSGIKYAHELNDNTNPEHLRGLKTELFKDINSYSETGKVPEHTSMYRVLYKDGKEVVVRYKDGKEIILQDKKRIKNFPLTGIVYVSKANGNQEFKDSLGFNSSTETAKKIFDSKSRFNSYNKEVKRLFDPKTVKTAVRTNGVFREGDTPRNIDSRYEYEVNKLTTKGEMSSQGRYFGKDLKSILSGYHFNGLYWDKKGSGSFYTLSKPKKLSTSSTSKSTSTKKKKSTSKSATKKSTTTKKKSTSKTTTKKSTTPKSAPKNTAAKPKVWEKGKKRVIKRK